MFYYNKKDQGRNSAEFQLRNFKVPSKIGQLKLSDYEGTPLYDIGVKFIEEFSNSTEPRGLYLHSENSGNGKSSFCVSLCRELIAIGKTKYNCFYYPADYLFEELRCIYNKGDNLLYTPFFKHMIAADVVIFDDMGVEKMTEFIAHRYYYIVNALWAEGRTVLMTSKFDVVDLMRRAHPDVDNEVKQSIASRMLALMEQIEVKIKADHREFTRAVS